MTNRWYHLKASRIKSFIIVSKFSLDGKVLKTERNMLANVDDKKFRNKLY